MRPRKNIENIIKEFNIDINPEKDQQIFDELSETHAKSQKFKCEISKVDTWRLIMKTRIAKFATLALIVVVATLSITFLDKTVTPTYAIEQTIEAMKTIRSIHAITTDWDGSRGEVWVKVNPQTGHEEKYYADQGNLLIVAIPGKTYYYYKDKNLVKIKNKYMPAAEVRFSHLLEDLAQFVKQYNGSFTCSKKFDNKLQKEVIVVTGNIPTQGDMKEKEFSIKVDCETKLPISSNLTKCGKGQGTKSVEKFEYNISISDEIFNFKIPEGAEVVYINEN